MEGGRSEDRCHGTQGQGTEAPARALEQEEISGTRKRSDTLPGCGFSSQGSLGMRPGGRRWRGGYCCGGWLGN